MIPFDVQFLAMTEFKLAKPVVMPPHFVSIKALRLSSVLRMLSLII